MTARLTHGNRAYLCTPMHRNAHNLAQNYEATSAHRAREKGRKPLVFQCLRPWDLERVKRFELSTSSLGS